MELSSSPVNGFGDDSAHTSRSPTARPTVNTSIGSRAPPITPLERSPLQSSSLSASSHSSPWAQSLSLTSPDLTAPHMYFHPSSGSAVSPDPLNGHSNVSTPHNEWNNIFAAPLVPAMFAQLAASGVLGPPPSVNGPSAASQPSSVPSRLPASNPRPSESTRTRHTRAESGTYTSQDLPSEQPYHKWPSFPAAPSIPSSSKGKSHSAGIAGFTPIQPRTSGANGHPQLDATGKPRGQNPDIGSQARRTHQGM